MYIFYPSSDSSYLGTEAILSYFLIPHSQSPYVAEIY